MQQGKSHTVYELVDSNFVINELKARIVREMFQIYSEGKSYGFIAKNI